MRTPRGFCWFAGRAGEWLRVDGENLGTAPVERALLRHPAVAEAAGVRRARPVAGDQIMACLVLRDGASLAPAELAAFLAAQGDIGPRQHPRFVRVATQLPRTPTFKVLTRVLAADRWNTADPVWWRPTGAGSTLGTRCSAPTRPLRLTPRSAWTQAKRSPVPGTTPAGPGPIR